MEANRAGLFSYIKTVILVDFVQALKTLSCSE